MDRKRVACCALLVIAAIPAPAFAIDFDALVDCRLEVERILHERREWPAANPGPKPEFESLVTRDEVVRGVEALLDRATSLAADGSLHGDDLQAELDRMASATRDPDLLDALFAAARTGETAATCLALPALVGRATSRADRSPRSTAKGLELDARAVTLPRIEAKGIDGFDVRQEPPDARFGHVGVWTGAEMIVFGGTNLDRRFNNGARYVPATDTWIPLPADGAPSPRTLATAVWSGLDVIVFGGYEPGGAMAPDHARYRPTNDIWGPVSTTNAPGGRYFHTAVWTGTSMIVFGGTNNTIVHADGGAYTPASNSWLPLPAPPAGNQRQRAAAVWTGTEMLVFGGISGTSTGFLATGLRFTPGTPGTWAPMGTTNVPSARGLHTGVWFAAPVSRFVVWGGETANGFTGDGALYDPAGDAWTPMSVTGAPAGRSFHTAISTGAEMIVWGGTNGLAFDDGARYLPASNTWAGAVQPAGNPGGRHQHTAVWTGDAMIVWGGVAAGKPLHSGGLYSPGTNAWSPTWKPRPCAEIGGNLLSNCGFESGGTGWSSPVIDARLYRGGGNSARQQAVPGMFDANTFVLGPCMPVTGDQRYEVGVHFRVDDTNSIGCGILLVATTNPDCNLSPRPLGGGGGAASIPHEWTPARGVTAATGPFDVSGRVVLNCIRTGSTQSFLAHFDDAFIVPLGDAVFADGFE